MYSFIVILVGQAVLSFKVKRFPSAVNFSDFLSVLIDN
jgi:hypothetical protein